VSDPPSRRSRNIKALLRNMGADSEGWTIDECARFLCREYGYGIRRGTAVDIIRELVELRVLYSKGLKFYVRKG